MGEGGGRGETGRTDLGGGEQKEEKIQGNKRIDRNERLEGIF